VLRLTIHFCVSGGYSRTKRPKVDVVPFRNHFYKPNRLAGARSGDYAGCVTATWGIAGARGRGCKQGLDAKKAAPLKLRGAAKSQKCAGMKSARTNGPWAEEFRRRNSNRGEDRLRGAILEGGARYAAGSPERTTEASMNQRSLLTEPILTAVTLRGTILLQPASVQTGR
jgi:hypothetical protein